MNKLFVWGIGAAKQFIKEFAVSNLLILLILSSLNSVFASGVEIVGAKQIHVNPTQDKKHVFLPRMNQSLVDNKVKKEADKIVSVLKINLSKEVLDGLRRRAEAQKIKAFNYDALTLPSQVKLGMNGVPVLDQGWHGTCVTFATTAALNAALAKGDYLSQLCHLSLGNYLENHYGQLSGWNGSWGYVVLSQINDYGYMNLADQRQYSCGGLKEYPLYDGDKEDGEMNPDEFARHSLLLSSGIYWEPIFKPSELSDDEVSTTRKLREVKESLAAGHRVSFGVLLDVNLGLAGAMGQHKVRGDTWIMTSDIMSDLILGKVRAGHEMVITGYDDNLQIGGQKGFFTLRNSWGKNMGDGGTYYMSYDYYSWMAIEAYRISSMHDKAVG